MFSRPFRKREVVPLATYTHTYKKGDIMDTKGKKKECLIDVTMATLEESTMLPSMLLALLYTNKLRAGFLPRE